MRGPDLRLHRPCLLPANVHAAPSFTQEPGCLSPLLPPIYCTHSSHGVSVVLSSKWDQMVSSPLHGHCLGLGAFKCPGSHRNLYFGCPASERKIFLQPEVIHVNAHLIMLPILLLRTLRGLPVTVRKEHNLPRFRNF